MKQIQMQTQNQIQMQTQTPEYLQLQNPMLEFDPFITFDEAKHEYKVNQQIYKPSVTTFVKHFFPTFDEDNMIKKMMANKKKWPTSPYFGMNIEQIKNLWLTNRDVASSQGTLMHATIEKFYNHPTLWKSGGTTEQFDLYFDGKQWDTIAFRQFLQWHLNMIMSLDQFNWIPFRTELRVFDSMYEIAGSVDMLFQTKTNPNELILVDWKNSKKITFQNNFKERGFGPCNLLDHCNYIHYSLQLNTYRHIIQANTKYRIIAMYLVVLHETAESAQMIAVPDMSMITFQMLENLRMTPLSKRDGNW